jgi:hypothetical protein
MGNILAVSILKNADARIQRNTTESRKFHQLKNVAVAEIERVIAAVVAPFELIARSVLTIIVGIPYLLISTKFIVDLSKTLKPTGLAFFQALGSLPKVFAPAPIANVSQPTPQTKKSSVKDVPKDIPVVQKRLKLFRKMEALKSARKILLHKIL